MTTVWTVAHSAAWVERLARAGFDVTRVPAGDLSARLAEMRPDALLIDGSLFPGPADLIGKLATIDAPTYAVLPAQASPADAEAVARVPCVKAVVRGAVDADALAARIRDDMPSLAPAETVETAPAERSAETTPAPRPPSSPTRVRPAPSPALAPRVRLGFYGARGGVGVTTAAAQAARSLAAHGYHAALFDATGRGDAFLVLGVEPRELPLTVGGVTVFPTAPSEEAAQGFNAIVIDGGRRRGSFNADWVEVSKPLAEKDVLALAGIVEEEREDDAPRVSLLQRLLPKAVAQ